MKSSQYKVIETYQSPYPDSIRFKLGEQVAVGRKYQDDPDWNDWYWCEANGGKKAWVPKQYIDIQGRSGTFNTCYDAKELTIQLGELVTVSRIVNGFGLAENSTGEIGWVPLRSLALVDGAGR